MRRSLAIAALVLTLQGVARAGGVALVLDCSDSAKRSGGEKAEAALTRWLEDAPPEEMRTFGTGDLSESHRASARAAFPHAWGGSSDLIAPLDRAIHWLAAVPGHHVLVLVSDLELDVIGDDDAPAAYVEGLPDDADRETVNRRAREVFRTTTLPRLRELGVKLVLVRLAQPEEARLVSLGEDLAALPGATILDPGELSADELFTRLAAVLPKRAPPPPPPPVVVPPVVVPPPPPVVVSPPVPPPVVAVVPSAAVVAPPPHEDRPAWRVIVGCVLIVVAIVSLSLLLLKMRPNLEGQRLVPIGDDGKTLESEVILAKAKTSRATARLALGRGALELRARKGGGVVARSKGVHASIEGVPIEGPTSIVHGMVLGVDSGDGVKPFVYLDRPLTPSEKKRSWIEPSEPAGTPLIESQDPDKKTSGKRGFLTQSKDSISDVASVDEIMVIDDSGDTLEAANLTFENRQILDLDDAGRITGEPRYFRAHRLDETTAAIELEGLRVSFEVEPGAGGGATLHPIAGSNDVALTIEGVAVRDEGASLVHGMVFQLADRAYVYMDRDPLISERGRVFVGPRDASKKDPSGRQREILAKDTVSDVGSVDEFYVVDDSEDEVID